MSEQQTPPPPPPRPQEEGAREWGRAGSCLSTVELAFNKAHVYCWAGARSKDGVWESRARQSHSSVRLATLTTAHPPAPDWRPSGGSWHTSQEGFPSLSVSPSLFMLFFSLQLLKRLWNCCQRKLLSRFIVSPFQSEPFHFFSLADAKMSAWWQCNNISVCFFFVG